MILYYTHKVPSNGTKQFICKKLVQYLYLSKKKKNQYLLKKKNMIYYFIAFNLCLDVSRKREKGKKKKKRQGNKQVQIKLRVGAQIDEEIRYGINRELTIEIFSHQRNQ